LITADYALEQGRELVVHRVGTAGERGAGSRRLAEQGAAVIEHAVDILNDWGWVPQSSEKKPQVVQLHGWNSTATQLARAMEDELAGRVVYRSGRAFEKK
jgi:predicted Rossmann fold nucleotide-binding protein DprA/Smf involved in DNA uptake